MLNALRRADTLDGERVGYPRADADLTAVLPRADADLTAVPRADADLTAVLGGRSNALLTLRCRWARGQGTIAGFRLCPGLAKKKKKKSTGRSRDIL